MAKISIEEAKERLQLLSSKQNPSSVRKVKKLQNDESSSSKTDMSDDIELVKVIDENIVIFKTPNGSFTVTPTDDELPPIIGVFDEIPEDETMPPCFNDWLNSYSDEVKVLQENEEPMADFDNIGVSGLKLIDLGLSVKWANMNIGATKPEEVGDYYAWGETEVKTIYKITTYKYYDSSTGKYKDIGNNICETEYDVAYKTNHNLSLPSADQLKELIEKCTWEKTTLNDVSVWKVTGPNGNSIYIPISGCKSESSSVGYKGNAYIWTGTKYSDSYGRVLKVVDKPEYYANNRRTGVPVRPVASSEYKEKEENTTTDFVDLGLSVNWASTNVGAEKPEEVGNYYAWGETETKKEYKIATYEYYDSATKKYKDIGSNICETQYDVAYKLDKNSCLPTSQQITELIEKCKWEKTTLNEKDVWKVTGPNGNSIYIPISGCISESEKVGYSTNAYIWTGTQSSSSQAKVLKITDKPTLYTNYKRTGTTVRPVSVKTNSNYKMIEPLIPYKWSQTAPYNNLVIIDPTTNKRCVTGCSNTALAMIVAYYGNVGVKGKKYRRGMTPTSEYVSTRGSVKINMPALDSVAEFDYDAMNYIKAADFKTEESKHAVAELMQHIGYASRSNYSSAGTGCAISRIATTAKEKMHLANNPRVILANGNYDGFKKQIYDELAEGFPVEISGFNSKGQTGHSFICDGYDPSTDWFHFNWGWGGNYNGWFDLSVLKVDKYDFSYSRQAIVGLHPEYIFGDTNDDEKINISDVGKVVQAIIDNKAYDYRLDINSDQKIDIHDVALLVDAILGKIKL